ncbi:MAG: ETC complex I subunit [Proteobacteria bacterium]|nr:ETC complex I subunit [Pseudomonadota bacterium]
MRVRIFKPAKTAMQSGRANTHHWVIEPEVVSARTPEPLMGWTSAGDTLSELRDKLYFKSQEEAVAFAEREGWDYHVSNPHKRHVPPRNYLDNFKWTKPESEAR